MSMTPVSMLSISYSTRASRATIQRAYHLNCNHEIDSAPVLPLIIYQGAHLQDAWTSTCDKDVHQLACVTQSGWNNTYIMLKWLEDVFDPYTRSLEEHAEELAIRKAKEEEAMRKRRIIVRRQHIMRDPELIEPSSAYPFLSPEDEPHNHPDLPPPI
ncbi:Hypothetical Protein CGB_E6230C [Cryptococcus gattii WM276]|uniref:DDE-1 domain-containing protein n=1 Tax=Cryptococcus gattii serotype B (strain WM276 / ATCC MYA-4071) TaxID=367775 RepID=E6R650_CRYGW|nr:Hypothetical Protein CGB_E6230C [Cryptococcus gattii WM276]ADV22733.1 Hypothetical Protein CGB_E6230C [Cryptococcus gattii WM276]